MDRELVLRAEEVAEKSVRMRGRGEINERGELTSRIRTPARGNVVELIFTFKRVQLEARSEREERKERIHFQLLRLTPLTSKRLRAPPKSSTRSYVKKSACAWRS